MPAKKMNERTERPQRSLRIVDKNEVEDLQKMIDRNYRSDFVLRDYGVMLGSEERIWIAARDVFEFDFSKLPVNSVGINFGKLKQNGKIRLTIEGSQLIGKTAERNVALIADDDAEKFLRGEDVSAVETIECENHNFVLLRTESGRVVGSAMFAEGKLKNFLPKSRRIM